MPLPAIAQSALAPARRRLGARVERPSLPPQLSPLCPQCQPWHPGAAASPHTWRVGTTALRRVEAADGRPPSHHQEQRRTSRSQASIASAAASGGSSCRRCRGSRSAGSYLPTNAVARFPMSSQPTDVCELPSCRSRCSMSSGPPLRTGLGPHPARAAAALLAPPWPPASPTAGVAPKPDRLGPHPRAGQPESPRRGPGPSCQGVWKHAKAETLLSNTEEAIPCHVIGWSAIRTGNDEHLSRWFAPRSAHGCCVRR